MAMLPDNVKPVICIAGPTASGKSTWAIELAQAVDGEIINADSMQVYSSLRIITARPSNDEMDKVPHHLFGHVDVREQYSTGQWLREVNTRIVDCLARHKTPILVGGTGLYFKALTEGLATIPVPDEGTMNKLKQKPTSELRALAKALDKVAAAKILGDDRQRLLRVVSVAMGTEKPLSAWQSDTKPNIPKGFWVGAVLLPERDRLYEKIDTRFEQMILNGGLEEIKLLNMMTLDKRLTVLKAIGVPPFIEHLNGKISYEEALFRAKRDTRRYAKRQFTWFRGQARDWFCVKNSNDRGTFRQKISHFYI